MNELNLHIDYVRTHLRDRVSARALVDRIEEDLDRTHMAALRAVADYVVVARNVHAVMLATRICRKGAKYAHLVGVLVGHDLGEPETRFNILIEGGWTPPLVSRWTQEGRRTTRRTPWVRVGARWILIALRTHLRAMTAFKKRLKPSQIKYLPHRSVEKFNRARGNTSNTHTESHT